jgi:hypothetical protein
MIDRPLTPSLPLLQGRPRCGEPDSKTATGVSAGHRLDNPAKGWWAGAGSNRRPSAFQGSTFPLVSAYATQPRATNVQHQLLIVIVRGSFAAVPLSASVDSSLAISASRPSTA